MSDLAERLRRHYDSLAAPVTVDEIIGDRADTVAPVMVEASSDSAADSGRWKSLERPGDDLTIEYLVPRDEAKAPTAPSPRSGAFLAVAKGAGEKPKFIVLEHNRDREDLDTIVLVGKGITFDTGGISI